jgi:acyl carrier protein
MKSALISFVIFVLRLLLRIRYKVEYKGLDEVSCHFKDKAKGVLFLPNHPAVIVDPLLVFLPLYKQFAARPLMVEYMYYLPLFHTLVRAIGALPIPNFSTGVHSVKIRRAEKTLSLISQELQRGQNFLIYPAGTTKHTAKEVLGGAFGVHAIIAKAPEVHVVLVRTTGLWGSSFSRAATAGRQVQLKEVFKKAFWTVLKNAIFFVPKRKVTIEFELAKKELPKEGTKEQLNHYLEEWYNRPFEDQKEPLLLISYSCFKKEYLIIPSKEPEKIDLTAVSKEVKEKITKKVAQMAKRPEDQILQDLKLIEHLGFDSLDIAELAAFLEDEFDVCDIIPEDLTTVGRLFLIGSKLYVKESTLESRKKPKSWTRHRPLKRMQIPDAQSIPEAFFAACDASLFSSICADALSGTTSYFTLKRALLLLSEKIKELPGERVGVLLPATTAAMLVVIACQMAGKVPVMINWTVGGRHLESVAKAAGLLATISSWKFLDRLENVDLHAIEDSIILLEELKAEIPLKEFLKKTIRSFFKYRVVIDPEKEAVCLFTSGTEGMPKGVPLTHKNILSNQRAALECVALFSSDILLSMLPPFHSFGFSITGLLPLLSGLRVVFYPVPTDSKRLVQVIDMWDTTVLCSAPTFLRNILNMAKKEQMSRVRLVISGAEKAPEELFSLLKKVCPEACLYEGYGITECAPVLTVNTSGIRENGVGRPLDNVELMIVDPQDVQKQKQEGQEGLILARGPNVFSGYLQPVKVEPFVEVDTDRWYQTGDLGFLSEEGNLIISGRLKRFVKIGGEMLSFAAIEKALQDQGDSSELPQYVVLAKEASDNKTELVLFTTKKHELFEVKQMLRKAGCSNLIKISLVIHIDTIPLTATGKIAYRELEALLVK